MLITKEQLKRFARYEISFDELNTVNDPDIKFESYTLTLDDLKNCLLKVQNEQIESSVFFHEWLTHFRYDFDIIEAMNLFKYYGKNENDGLFWNETDVIRYIFRQFPLLHGSAEMGMVPDVSNLLYAIECYEKNQSRPVTEWEFPEDVKNRFVNSVRTQLKKHGSNTDMSYDTAVLYDRFSKQLSVSANTSWIFPCNLNDYDIHGAIADLESIDWRTNNYKVQTGDIIYLYISAPESAIKYKCRVIEANKQYSTVDDTAYGGNPAGTVGQWAEIKCIFKFPEPGVTLAEMRKNGIKQNNSMQGANKVPEALAQLLSYWEIGALPRKEEPVITDADKDSGSDLTDLKGYEREALIKARVNQSVYRNHLIEKYGKCCLCGVKQTEFLVASHIKPWSKSDNKEKVDTENGLLLCPNHDKLFDSGYISFDDNGNIMISSELQKESLVFLNVHESMHINLTKQQKKYMKYHRDHIFKK